jgi:S1-C subfamily serine protease
VHVKFDLPYPVSGLSSFNAFQGTGLIVDRERGWVLVDRNTVPVAMGDVTITFAGSLQVPGTVEYLHPLHNMALVSYDPLMIGDTPVAEAVFDTKPLISGDPVWLIGLRSNHQLAQQEGVVSVVDSLVLPLSGTMMFRDSNIDTVALVNGANNFDGVLVNSAGAVQALWSSFAFERNGKKSQLMRGLSIELAQDFVRRMQDGKPIYSLEVEANYVPLFSAAELGLSRDWQLRLEQQDPQRRRVLKVRRVVVGTEAGRWLKSGDLILAVDGQLVTRFRQLERAVQRPRVRLSLWRSGALLELDIATTVLHARGIDSALSWAGALLQTPHRSLAAQRGIERSGVFVAHYSPGSPAARYGLQIGRRMVEVDGQATPDLATFIEQVRGRKHRSSLRLKTVNWNRSVEVITLKLDKNYWPAYQFQRSAKRWRRSALD